MKRLLLVIILLLATSYSYAQNTFPSTGNVGVGTASPATALDVWGPQRIISSSSTAFQVGNAVANYHITYSGLTGNTWFYTFSSQNFLTSADGNTRINGSNVLFYNNAQIMDYQQPLTIMRSWPANGLPGGLIIDNDTRTDNSTLIIPSNYKMASFRLTGIEKSYIDQTGGAYFAGNVGIGTTQPDQALTVNGTIHSTQVLVDQTIKTPDYVFDKDYDLTSLKDVKTYIDKNHHLPEIPSASQVAKDGINLGEMNTKLLKKIEELILYLIEKDKELSKQKLKIKHQQQQLNRINRKLNLN